MNKNENAKINMAELIKNVPVGETEGEVSKQQVDDFINKNLTDSQAKAVRDLLSDPEKTKAVLNSDAAKKIFQKFFGGQK